MDSGHQKFFFQIWNLKFGAKPNVSLIGAFSPIGGKVHGGKIPPVARSRGLKSNVLAYAERVLRVGKH